MTDIIFKLDNREVSLSELRNVITDPLTQASLNHMIETVNREVGDQRCPTHNEPPHITVSLTQSGELHIHTVSCCQMFEKTATAPLQRQLNKTAYFNPGLKLILKVVNSRDSYILNVTEITKLELGRGDTGASEQPDINFGGLKALELGVSRRHATILWQRGALHIADNNSSNGTFVNEKRVDFDEPQILHDGDTLRLGQLEISVMLGSG